MTRRVRRATTIVLTAAALLAVAPNFAAPVAASAMRAPRTAETRVRSSSLATAATRSTKKKHKKKVATSLTSKALHAGVIAVVLTVVGFGLFLIGSGVRGPRGRKRRRMRTR